MLVDFMDANKGGLKISIRNSKTYSEFQIQTFKYLFRILQVLELHYLYNHDNYVQTVGYSASLVIQWLWF